MRKPSLPLLSLYYSLLLLCFTAVANAGETPVVRISARPSWITAFKTSDKKIPARRVDGGYFYQLYEQQIQVEKKADYRHIVKEIVSEAGIQNGSEISISYNPSYEQLEVHYITVWRNGQPQSRLTPRSFKVIADEKELSRFIYQGSYSAFCILGDVQKGDRIEYAYTITGRNPIFGNKYADELYLQGNQPYAQLYKAIFVSPERKLNVKTFNNAVAATVSDKSGFKCYEWNLTQVMPPPYADNEPAWFNNYQHIQLSDYSNWQEVADWARNINPVATQITGKLAEKVAQLKLEAKGNKEKYFRSAVQLVQDQVRYMGIELGEYSHRANSPEKVYSQRYGDCKDKALLLASILQANGIEAHMVLINTDAAATLDDYLPSPVAFNHACVAAVVNNKPVYVDATIAYQRGAGTDLYFPNYARGLVLKPGASALTTIIPSKAGKTLIVEKYTVPDTEKAKVDLVVTSTYTLSEADRMRDKLASGSMAETEKSYFEYYAKIYPKVEYGADSVIVKDDPERNILTTIEHYRVPDFFKPDKKDEGRVRASFYANYINDQLPNIQDKNLPVSLNFPNNIEHVIKVVMSNGWNIDNEDYSIKRDAYAFRSQTSAMGDTLILDYKYNALKDFVGVNKLAEARQDVKEISDNQLSYSFIYAPDVSKLPFRINYWMIAFTVVLALAFALTGVILYRRRTRGLMFERGAGFTPLGGWLILVAIGLALTPFAVGYTMAKGGFYDLNKWNVHFDGANDMTVKALFVFEAGGNIFLICFAVFCFIMLINRRDILPKYITGFYAFSAVFALVDLVLASGINGQDDPDAATGLIRKIIFAAIWIAYFKRSERVEITFIVPFPKTNYSYEGVEVPREKAEVV